VDPEVGAYGSTVAANFGTFFYAIDYFSNHSTKLDRSWRPDDAMMASFRTFLDGRGISGTDAEFGADKEWLRERLREELFVTAFSKERSEQVGLENDPEVARALASMASSRALLARSHQVVASKPNRIARLFHQEQE